MGVLYDIKLMLFNYSTGFAFDIKTQEGHEPIVERHGNAHLFDSYLYVVNYRFHRSIPKMWFYDKRQTRQPSCCLRRKQ
jgi:hypothetical protein